MRAMEVQTHRRLRTPTVLAVSGLALAAAIVCVVAAMSPNHWFTTTRASVPPAAIAQQAGTACDAIVARHGGHVSFVRAERVAIQRDFDTGDPMRERFLGSLHGSSWIAECSIFTTGSDLHLGPGCVGDPAELYVTLDGRRFVSTDCPYP